MRLMDAEVNHLSLKQIAHIDVRNCSIAEVAATLLQCLCVCVCVPVRPGVSEEINEGTGQ